MFYTLMHKRIPVADISMDDKIGFITEINKIYNVEHFPVGTVQNNIPQREGLNGWWRGRGIPANRSGLREAIEILGVSSEKELLAKCYGLSLSDQYWICPKGSGLTWDKINFFDNSFSRDVGDVLFGLRNKPSDEDINLISPDNTSDGWLKKRWVIHKGKRKLIKAGSPPYRQEPYNEVLTSALCNRLGIDHVDYKLVPGKRNPACTCADFVDSDTELVSAWYVYNTMIKEKNVSPYNHLLECCAKMGIAISEYLDKIITVDYIIANTDRHLNNFGIIRNAETLTWIRPAPIYDSGTSLWHNADIEMIKPTYKISSKPFRNNHNDQIKLVKDFTWLDFNSLHSVDEEFEAILTNSVFIRKERRDSLCAALKTRVKSLRGIVMGLSKKHPPPSEDLKYDY
jgi:hypothetical protein